MTDEQALPLTIQIVSATTNDELDMATRGLRLELEELDPGIVFITTEQAQIPGGAKPVDPLTLGLIAVAVGPTVLIKVLEFLHAWCMRREGQTVSIEIQNGKGSTIKVQVPASMDRQQVKAWIKTVQDTLKK